ncbi:choice-of-anchor A family protein [uncultured Massilia sp.]|uniref:choice-of-anchor A family protein n=1 Tax=uncultured Massilia sp. TaxID=169973 RepID=UPI0025D98A7F|nr:choice-of-anchor A family protein [uncultured Massilia sp.]
MPASRHLAFAAAVTALCAGPAAHAALLDLAAPIGGANVYAIKNFTSSGSDTEGAIVAGGNVTLSGYRVNDKNKDAFSNYSVVAGGNVNMSNGNIVNGLTYAGGTITAPNWALDGVSTVKPIDFKATESYYKTLSSALDKLANTGTVTGGAGTSYVSGSGKGGVDIFDVSGNIFQTSKEWKLSNLVPGQTLIFNVSGSSGSFADNNIEFASLSGYNVLFNFYEATSVDVRSVIGSILAPYATVSKNSGNVNGTVIVDTWNSTVQINTNGFKAVEVAGLNLGTSTPPSTAVPEPASIALVLGGLAAFGLARRRKP